MSMAIPELEGHLSPLCLKSWVAFTFWTCIPQVFPVALEGSLRKTILGRVGSTKESLAASSEPSSAGSLAGYSRMLCPGSPYWP